MDFCCGRFVWDEAKYPTMSPLKEVIDSIHGQVAKIEDDLKVMLHIFCFNLMRCEFPKTYWNDKLYILHKL